MSSGITDVIVVGAGAAGLNCARILRERGASCRVIEGSDDVGGRIRTDRHQGFLLDRGFQLLLTAYPETRRTLDFDRLDLRHFTSGALVQHAGKRHRIVHPGFHPTEALSAARFPLATLGDKARAARLGVREAIRSDAEIFAGPDFTTTDEFLRRQGFSRLFIETFLRPFFAGVFLENELRTSSRFFEFLYKMFGLGRAAIPARGMGQLTLQLAAELSHAGCITLGRPVAEIREREVRLADGERLRARQVVLATELPAARRLLGLAPAPEQSKSSCTLYFAAPEPPVDEPILVLNGDGHGIVNNLNVISRVAPDYAPSGAHLIAASVVGVPTRDETELRALVRAQAREWFGAEVDRWEHLRSYVIPHSLPMYSPRISGRGMNRDCPDWLELCGDYLETPSIEGAIRSGRRTAEAILRKLGRAGADLARGAKVAAPPCDAGESAA